MIKINIISILIILVGLGIWIKETAIFISLIEAAKKSKLFFMTKREEKLSSTI